MTAIRFDTVLARADTSRVVAAVDELGSERRLSGRGAFQSNSTLRQFEFAVDEREQWWVLTYDDGQQQRFRDGIVQFGQEGPRDAEFFRPMPQVLQMLWPTRLLTWANPHGSFYPVLVQQIGQRSILFTFEHVDDPAFRQTLVMDADTGIAKRLIGYDYGLIITEINELSTWGPNSVPVFEPITGPIPPDY